MKKILRKLVEHNLQVQRDDKAEFLRNLNSESYISEAATVILKNCRRSGHTSAGLALGKKHHIVFITHEDNIGLVKKSKYYLKYSDNIKLLGQDRQFSEHLEGAIRANPAEVLVVDNASKFPKKLIDLYSKTIYFNTTECIVLLG